jgi:hypothetical protein
LNVFFVDTGAGLLCVLDTLKVAKHKSGSMHPTTGSLNTTFPIPLFDYLCVARGDNYLVLHKQIKMRTGSV